MLLGIEWLAALQARPPRWRTDSTDPVLSSPLHGLALNL
jgi:hypothetical protein